MKNSTVFAIALCGVLASAVTGCKYDDSEGAGDLAAGSELVDPNANTAGTDVATDTTDEDEAARRAAELAALNARRDADATSLADATGVPFDQDPNYARCTDVDFAPVYFGFDADVLAPSELAKIEAVAQHLKLKTDRVVIIEGNCDERGSNEYNLVLGEQRAIRIFDYLVKQLGIDERRVQTKSYGEEKPAVVGSDEAAWSKNRRGEFAVYQHK